jgi:hypothetical protein
MMVSCARSDHAAAGTRVQLIPSGPSGPLVYGMHLAAGVHVELDVTAPGRWHAVSYATPEIGRPLLHALLGGPPTPDVTQAPSIERTVPDSPAGAVPWFRVAAVDALDRWLHAPLDQGLLDAERGIARGRAARTLPHGPVRAVLTGEALRMARRSSRDLVVLMRRLGRHSRPVPTCLRSTVKNVVDGYAELIDDVVGSDQELTRVLDGWRRLSRRLSGVERPAAVPSPQPEPAGEAAARPRARLNQAMSMIDPRQVRARVLAVSSDPASPEIAASATDDDSVLVRVPAFGATVAPEVAARLLVRLVDRRSAESRCHALLRATRDGACFEATVPLWGLDAKDVRADVADALSDLAPAADDADDALHEARRAVVFLAEWRRLVGAAQLGLVTAAPAHHLRKLAARLQPTRAEADAPLFTGGPSCTELEALADLGDAALLQRLRGDGPLGEELRAVTAGPGGLLVAELAASFLAPAA